MVNFEGMKLELKKALQNIMIEETKAWLIKSLLRTRLATWDIYHFAKQQAGLRSILRHLDWQTMSSALRAKLRDILTTLTQYRRIKSRLECQIREFDQENKAILKQILSPWKKIVKEEKRIRIDKFKAKINHYKKKQEPPKAPYTDRGPKATVVPRYLTEYRDLSIFGAAKMFPKKKPPLGPFIGSKEITLSKEELLILAKDPKFSLRYGVDVMDFKTEVEKMIAKKKYGVQFKEKQNKNKISIMNDTSCIEKDARAPARHRAGDAELNSLWEEDRKKLVFDPLINRIDFRKRRPTDYKHNKRISLPTVASTDVEFECERRRREYMKCMKKYLSEKYNNGKKRKEKKKRIEKERDSAKKKIENLTNSEAKGFKSLCKRVSDGELVITTTDKSSRMAVVTKEQYIRAGNVHTQKDEEISWKDIKYMQNQINAHIWWATRILGNSENTDPDRMGRNITELGYQVPEMFLLVKDHKSWSGDAESAIPTRPVLSGNNCINTHLSELVSELIEPISMRLQGAEINSTEEALNKITSLNMNIRNKGNWLPESSVIGPMGEFRSGNKLEAQPETSYEDLQPTYSNLMYWYCLIMTRNNIGLRETKV